MQSVLQVTAGEQPQPKSTHGMVVANQTGGPGQNNVFSRTGRYRSAHGMGHNVSGNGRQPIRVLPMAQYAARHAEQPHTCGMVHRNKWAALN